MILRDRIYSALGPYIFSSRTVYFQSSGPYTFSLDRIFNGWPNSRFWKLTVIYLSKKKNIFAGNTLNMMILSSLASSPRNVLSIPAFYLKKIFDRKPPLNGFFQKKFSHKKSSNPPKSSPHRFLGRHLVSVPRFSNARGGASLDPRVPYEKMFFFTWQLAFYFRLYCLGQVKQKI